MAINFVAAQNSVNTVAQATITIAFPSGSAAGHHAIIATLYRGGTGNAPTTPTSPGSNPWVAVDPAVTDSTTLGLASWHKILEAADISAGSVVVTHAAATHAIIGSCYVSSGVDTTTPLIDADATVTGTASTSATAPTVNPGGVSGAQLVVFYAINGNTSISAGPAGMTQRDRDNTLLASNVTAAVYDEALAGSGATGTRVATIASARSIGQSILLRPAATGGGASAITTVAVTTPLTSTGTTLTAAAGPSIAATNHSLVFVQIRDTPDRSISALTGHGQTYGALSPASTTDGGTETQTYGFWEYFGSSGSATAVAATASAGVASAIITEIRATGLKTTTSGADGIRAGGTAASGTDPSSSFSLSVTGLAIGERVVAGIFTRFHRSIPDASLTILANNITAGTGGDKITTTVVQADNQVASGTVTISGIIENSVDEDWHVQAWILSPVTTGSSGSGSSGATRTTFTIEPKSYAVAGSVDVNNGNRDRGMFGWRGEFRVPAVRTLDYQRRDWRQIEVLKAGISPTTANMSNPANYTYDWSWLDSQIATSAAAGRMFFFRLRTMVDGVPEGTTNLTANETYLAAPYYIYAMGLTRHVSYTKAFGADAGMTYVQAEPKFDDPQVQQYLSAFVMAAGARYNTNPTVWGFENGLLGRYGEWTFKGTLPSAATHRYFIDLGMNAFPDKRNIIMIDGQSNEPITYAGTTYLTREAGIAFREDSWPGGFGRLSTLGLGTAWQKAPLIAEWLPSDLPGSLDEAITKISSQHVAMLGNGNSYNYSSYTATQQGKAVQIAVDLGHRFAIEYVDAPSTIAAGTAVPILIRWHNDGVAPAYDPIDVDIELRTDPDDPATMVFRKTSVENLRRRFPTGGTGVDVTDQLQIPANLGLGTYSLVIVPHYTSGIDEPLMLLNPAQRQADNSYLVKTVTVVAATTTLVPTAPTGLVFTPTATLAISWTDNANNEQGYRIGVDGDSHGEYRIYTDTLLPDVTSVSIPLPDPQQTINVEVWAYNAAGDSTKLTGSYTNPATYAEISTATATNTGAGIRIDWAPYPLPVLIEKSINGGTDYTPWRALAAIDAPQGTITDTDAVPVTSGAITYRYRVATDDGAPSYVQTATVAIAQAAEPVDTTPLVAPPPDHVRLEWIRNGYTVNLTDNITLTDGIKVAMLEYEGLGSVQSDLLIDRAPFQQSVTGRGFRRQPRVVNLIFEAYADVGVENKYLHLAYRRLARLFQTGVLPGTLKHTSMLGDVRLLDAHFRSGLDWPSKDSVGHLAQRIAISLQANEPTWYAETDTVVFFQIAMTEIGATIPAPIPRAVGASTLDQSQIVVYDGDVNVSPIITIRGPITAPGITNETTGAALTFADNITIPADTVYTVDTRDGFLYVQSSADGPGMYRTSELTPTSDLAGFQIVSEFDGAPGGVNTIRVVGSAGNTQTAVAIRYRPRYLSS